MKILLKSPHDENLFEYYATSQLALVDSTTGRSTPLGQPAIFQGRRSLRPMAITSS